MLPLDACHRRVAFSVDLTVRGFDPRIPEAPTQITDAREAEVEGKSMCVVKGYVSPQVQFEVRLPIYGWTQRYLQTGFGDGAHDLRVARDFGAHGRKGRGAPGVVA